MADLYGSVPTGAGNTVVAAFACALKRVEVIATGTGTATVYDNASTNSGNVALNVPASAAVGTIYELDMAMQNGITVANTASGPVLNVTYE